MATHEQHMGRMEMMAARATKKKGKGKGKKKGGKK